MECVRMCLMLGLGALIGVSFHKRLRCMGFPMFAVFGLAADPELYWGRHLAAVWLDKVGWWRGPVTYLLWRAEWIFVPVVIFAILSLWLIRDSGKLRAMEKPRAAERCRL